jgi:hypothetical protein
MYEIIKSRNRLNLISQGFSNIGSIFGDTSLELPKLRPSELGFIRAVSWFYVHYFETGKLGTEFLSNYSGLCAISAPDLKEHRLRIQQLRTYCQHNLNFSDNHSQMIQTACQNWFKEKCGTHLPSEEMHWECLLSSIISEAKSYFDSLETIIRAIEGNGSMQEIVEQWNLRLIRYQAPHKFDRIIEEVALDWGRPSFNVVKFRLRYYDRWKKIFENRTDDCDFEREARKLVEHALLSEEQNVMPIDGIDVMETFDVPPGGKVKEILGIAKEIYATQPCTKEKLLGLIRARIEPGTEG